MVLSIVAGLASAFAFGVAAGVRWTRRYQRALKDLHEIDLTGAKVRD